jgi:hypothetical protein|tara:strand:+ start:914 stop:1126 length:213 start_codon:yes stop_codon:yes gene_type:complete
MQSLYGAIANYKLNYMEKNKSKGLGDTVAKFTKATGIKKVVDTVSKVTGKDCGCGERQNTLNRLFPYNNK